MTRTFIAIKIDLNPEIQNVVDRLKNHLRNERIRWVTDENLHLTLRFLGDLNEGQILNVKDLLSKISKESSEFTFKLKGLSYFGKKQNPSVIYIGIGEDDHLQEFVSTLFEKLDEYGFEKENRKYSPHLTLGRMKFLNDKSNFFRLLENIQKDVEQLMYAKEIILYKSILKSSGPKYVVIHKYSLR